MKRSKLVKSGTTTKWELDPDFSQTSLGLREGHRGHVPEGSRHFFSDVSPDGNDRSGVLLVPSSKVRGSAPFQRSALASSTTNGVVFRISAFIRSTTARDSPSRRIPSARP